MSQAADRNLLFGILALQMDFVSREALIRAMNAWVLEKAKPLGQVLREQAALDADTHALLEALVQRHLALHGNDPERSLAAVSSLGSVREQLEQIPDPDLQASLAHASRTRSTEDDPLATRAPSVGAPTSWRPRFRILRPHARGGLGEVYVARDEELHRDVALKEIRGEHADHPESRARFLREAEVTGGLEHPGVVPVYGLGRYADGRPYYAMRFIKGDSLKDAIAAFHAAETPGRDPGERALAFRGLLGRFVDVCQAVAYAHSRGVLHRDLKPGNVMLGKFGETLVVDWGLAKPLGRTESEGGASEGPLVPPSGDVSLATQAGQVIGTPAFMSPEQAAGQPDLLGPASDVYSLGATLYALLAGRAPVKGHDKGDVLQRVGKGDWPRTIQVKKDVPKALDAVCCKAMALRPEDRYAQALDLAGDVEHWLADEPVSCYREPLPVRAGRWARRHQALVAGAAAALLVAVLLGGAGAWWLNRQRLRAENAESLAQQRLAQVNAVNEFLQKDLLGQAYVGNQPQPGGAGERNRNITVGELLDRAARAVEGKFAAQPLTEAAIRLTLGDTYRGLGRYPESQRHLERSVELRSAQLGADDPDTLSSKNNLAVLYKDQGKYDQAEPLYKEVLDARTARLGADHPDTLESKNNLAVLYDDQGQYDRAEPLYQEVLNACTAKLGADHPHTLMSKNNLAALYQAQGKYDRAETLCKEVLGAFTAQLGADHPDTLTSKNNLASMYKDQGQYDRAEPLYKEVLDARTAQLPADHPDTLQSKNNLAELYHYRGEYARAEPLYKEVLDARTAQLGADHPHTLESKNNLALLYRDQGQSDRAKPLLKEVLDASAAKLGADHPNTLRTKNSLGGLYRAQGKYGQSESLHREAIAGARKKLGIAHPHTQQYLRDLSKCYEKMGQPGRGEPLLRELADFWKQKAGPDASPYAEQLDALGANLLLQKKGAEAEAVLRPALAIRQQKEADAWTTFHTQSLLGGALLLQRKHAEAEPLLVQGYEGLKQRETKIPPRSKERLTEAVERLVQLYDAWGKKDQADTWRKKLEAVRPPKPEGKP
jgi:tetratricopeptide (TPR) repeat protein/tRNA A-37 threonylcarbamoyl transferase component Bud32